MGNEDSAHVCCGVSACERLCVGLERGAKGQNVTAIILEARRIWL